jgi:uncharacterized membrane-anchored protein
MPVFRFLAAVCLLVATIALVDDATPAVYGAGPFVLTSLSAHWQDLAPSAFAAAQKGADSLAPWLWKDMLVPILAMPTCIAFGLLAVLFGYVGRRRRAVEVFIN